MERITVKNDEKEVILDFDTRFYPLNFIVSASKDFSGFLLMAVMHKI